MPLRPVFSAPDGPGPLEHQRCDAARRLPLDQPARGRRAELLVAGDQQRHPVQVDAELVEPGQGVEGLHQAGLHVDRPGPADELVGLRPRHALESAQGPDGVVVAQEHHAVRPGAEAPAGVTAAVELDSLRGEAEPLRAELGDQVGAAPHRGEVGGRRLAHDQRAEVLDHLGQARLDDRRAGGPRGLDPVGHGAAAAGSAGQVPSIRKARTTARAGARSQPCAATQSSS